MNNGGPAFPVECTLVNGELRGIQTGNKSGWHEGMTLRDYFAAAAVSSGMCPHNVYDGKEVAQWAYGVADEMIYARQPQSERDS